MKSRNNRSFKEMDNCSPTRVSWESYFAGNAQVDDDLATDRLYSRPNRIAEFRRKNPGYKPGKKNKTPEDLLLHFQSAGFNFKTPQEAVEYKRNLDLSKARGGNRGRVVYSTNQRDMGSIWGTTRKIGTGQKIRNSNPSYTK